MKEKNFTKKSFISLIFVLCMSNFLLKAQEKSKLTVSPPYSVIDATNKYYFIKDDNLYAVKFNASNIKIQKYETNTPKYLDGKSYGNILPEESKAIYVKKIDSKYYLFFVKLIKKPEIKELLFYTEIDFDNLSISSKYETIIDVSTRVRWISNLNTLAPKYGFYFSPDKSKFLLQYRKASDTKRNSKSKEELGLLVYDAKTMKKISGNEIQMPYVESDMKLENVFLDNEGQVHVSIYNLEKDEDEVIQINVKTKSIYISKRPSTKEWGYNFYASISNDNKLCFLSTSDKGKQIFLQNVDKGQMKFKIPQDIYSKYEKLQRFKGFSVRGRFDCEDGGFLLVAQQYWDTTVIRMSGSGSNYKRYKDEIYFYNDLIVLKVDKDLKMQWIKQIPHGTDYSFPIPKEGTYAAKNYLLQKHQHHSGMHYFFHYVMESPIIEITDDMSKKERKKAEKLMRKLYRTAYVDVVDEKDGTFKTIRLFNLKNINGRRVGQFKFYRTRISNDGSIISEVYGGDKQDLLLKNTIE
ncbi:MAG: hypothetical protein ACRBFS_14370 [Aureispira sp.]